MGRCLSGHRNRRATYARTSEHAQQNEEWQAFQYTTAEGGNVSDEELASTAREIDDRLYRQEFEASFEGIGHGQACYAFSRTENVRRCQFDPQLPLIWALDFNVHPMSSVLLQQVGDATQVLDEMVLPNANTPAACEELLRRTEPWQRIGTVAIEVYGDASGYQRRTSGAASDWALIRDFFLRWTGQFRPSVRAATSNPPVRDRINVVNSRLYSASSERRLFVDPRCRDLIRDLERVCWKTDGTGQPTNELDKSDRLRTHISDALGYHLAQAFPLRLPIGHCGTGRVV